MKKIIFATRSDFYKKFGGDNIQLTKTKEFLEKLYGLDINICTNVESIIEDKDSSIVHLFNMQSTETLDYIKASRASGKKIVLTPVYWNLTEAYYSIILSKINPDLINENTLLIKKPLIQFFNKILNINPAFRNKRYFYPHTGLFESSRREILDFVDKVLPNSDEELKLLSKDFGLNFDDLRKKSSIIPNAVDVSPLNISCELNHCLSDELDDFVLQVGRIEPVKNQLNLIKALYDLPHINIVFVGAIGDKQYYKSVYNLAQKRGNVYFVDKVSHIEVFHFYQKAKIHVMPSFRESPGLASLEALISGCKIVVSSEKFCPVNYYEFDKYGYTCNPHNLDSIKNAVLTAIDSESNLKIDEKYKQKFSYENVAHLTYKAYEELWK